MAMPYYAERGMLREARKRRLSDGLRARRGKRDVTFLCRLPFGLGSGIDKPGPTTLFAADSGHRPHLPDARRAREFALVLVNDCERSHGTRRSGDDS
jgi:hypothetical protein